MNHYCKNLFTLLVFSFLGTRIYAQYGTQFENCGFEQWTSRDEQSVSEPTHWHSTGTATGTYASWLPSNPQIESSTHLRPGSSGTKSLRIIPRSVLGITANGTVTNGRMNASSMSASGAGNYNYTQRSQSVFNTPITQCPDSLTIWVCFRSQSTSHKAQVKAVVHGDADYKIKANGSEDPANMHVATADQRFTRTAANGGAYNWTRLSIPFVNNGPCTDVRYILMMATTNESPGTGSINDDLFVDDVLLIYNPTLSMGQLASNSYAPGDAITIPFTLTGTMSPDNFNASANKVIAQLSDANGSFSNPTELGRLTTNTSGSIAAQIPNVPNGTNYQVRVVSTNYPMTGTNIQVISIMPSTFNITVASNPSQGGTVTGGGTYNSGQSCTVSATANTGYTFTNWTENGNVVSTNASYTFNVEGNRSLVANFEANTIPLSQGCNWFSSNMEITLDDLKAALLSALNNASGIKITSQSNGYTIWNGSSWKGSLNPFEVCQMYVIDVPSACEITLEAMPIDPAEQPITILPGFNWIGFPLDTSMSIEDAFAGFAVSGDKVSSKSQNAIYTGIQWEGTLNTLVPGQGYMFESSQTGNRTFIFPSGR